MTKLTLEVRTKAVEALRTTTRQQCRGALARVDGSNCALGVIAAEVLGIEPLPLPRPGDPGYDGRRLAVAQHAEIAVTLDALGFPYDVAARNDLEGMSFPEIADWLEQQPACDPPTVPDTVPAEWTEVKVSS